MSRDPPMTDVELNAELSARDALVVHFSHHATMREGVFFPQDLHDAIQYRDDWPLSCCVVWPNHQMELPGSVGVIFSPSVSDVLSVLNTDSGSSIGVGGKDNSDGIPLSRQSLSASFNVLGHYNEWRVRGAEVYGVYVSDVDSIAVRKEVRLDVGARRETFVSAEEVAIDEVVEAFPDCNIYTISDRGIVEI